ncbi:GAF and ANTAR domain-containing protein [Arthrobacter ramosus]|uniref:GAF and ANTAR domain-containing protein n=1 Tax=Arthrobacter ramosus TaxID=1672 RepID=A0ABV5Y328_ARTRM|nr:GAF and ANTAR domain-containing protein [Arthrobacter ramosus]
MTSTERRPTRTALAGLAAHPDQDLGIAFQDLVLASADVAEFLGALANLAAAALTTAYTDVSCGVTVVTKKKGITTASSDERVRALDELQIDFGDGPCLTALRHNSVILVLDTRHECRWGDYMEAVWRNGIGSILAVPLDLAGEAEAVMSLYSTTPHGFSGPDITAAEEFAESAAKSLRLALTISQLRNARDDLTAAMQSRSTIDTAVGIVMAQSRCGRDTAFKVLTRASNSRNVKLRDIAANVIASVSGETDPEAYFDE